MKRLLFISVAIALATARFARVVFAGVVMSETAIAAGPSSASVENRTIYVQGNKEKIEKPNVDAITDLDKGVVYIVDKSHKEYVQLPLQSLVSGGANGSDSGVEAIRLHKTGQTHVIANQHCTEYRETEANELEHVTVSACISRNAPGANEVIAFEQKMISRLQDAAPQQFEKKPLPNAPEKRNDESAGLLLQNLSVISFRVPDPSQSNDSYRTVSFVTRTELKHIQVKQLPDDAFAPPRSFVKLEKHPSPHTPSQSPHASDDNEV